MKAAFSLLLKKILPAFIAVLSLASCVHQFPEQDETADVVLTVKHVLNWLPDYEMTLTRATDPEVKIRYDFKVYPKDNYTAQITEFTIFKDDLNRQDFTTTLELMPGEYDLYAWSDYCDAATGEPIYYSDDNFADITYIKPYEGDTNLRDAFRGKTSFRVEESGYYEAQPVDAVITMVRPLARFMFVATDLADFIDKEATRGKMSHEGPAPEDSYSNSDNILGAEGTRWAKLSDYTVRISYPLYMPAVFNNFLNNPVDSWTNVSFNGAITQLSATQARLGMDYVYVNGDESGVQVVLEVYDPDKTLVARTNVITVPTVRNRTTIIYGKFLTTLRNDGVGINPDFDGEFNIEIF